MLYYSQEVREMKAKRNRYSIRYRIFHWFNTLTLKDVKRASKYIFSTFGELLTILFLLFVIFILPSFFH